MSRFTNGHASPVHAALARQFAAPRWATFFEVRDDAGFKAQRTADAVSVATWTSMGLAVWGFEVKRSRSDFLRELRQPEKCSTIVRYCDRWVLAVADAEIAKPDEVPAVDAFEGTSGIKICNMHGALADPIALLDAANNRMVFACPECARAANPDMYRRWEA